MISLISQLPITFYGPSEFINIGFFVWKLYYKEKNRPIKNSKSILQGIHFCVTSQQVNIYYNAVDKFHKYYQVRLKIQP